MHTYHVVGLHCEFCARGIELRLRELEKGEGTRLDYLNKALFLSEEMNLAQVAAILQKDGITLADKEAFKAHYSAPAGFRSLQETAHPHSHGHSHHHDTVDFSAADPAARNIKLVFLINLLFSIAEFVFGFIFNSAAILSDAVHDLGDAASVGLAWILQKISNRRKNKTFTFGYKRFSLLGALLTTVILIAGSAFVMLHALPKLQQPEPINTRGMMILAVFAILANGYAAYLMSRGKSRNESALNLHMLEDVLGWVAVLLTSIVVHFTDWYILDPILSIVIAVYILYLTVPQFISNMRLFLEGVPENIRIDELTRELQQLEGVVSVLDIRVWSIDGEHHALNAVLQISKTSFEEQKELKEQIKHYLEHKEISYSSIEFE